MSMQNMNKVKSADIELKDKLVAVNRVTKVTKGGRTFSFSAIVVVGDENGVVGHGLGKAKEVTEAITKGIDDAKKNLIKVPIYRGTVPHAQNGKYGGALGAVPGAGGSGIVVLAYPTAQFSSAFSYNVGSITGDANSNLSLQVTNILSITGNTQIAGALQTSTSATSMQTLSTLAINDRTTPSTGSLYQISSVLYYNSTVIGGVTAASIQAFTF